MTAEPAETASNRPEIGWGRAIISGLVILVVAVVASVGGANTVLTRATSWSRSTREYVAAIEFLVVVVLMAWAVRVLQRGGLI